MGQRIGGRVRVMMEHSIKVCFRRVCIMNPVLRIRESSEPGAHHPPFSQSQPFIRQRTYFVSKTVSNFNLLFDFCQTELIPGISKLQEPTIDNQTILNRIDVLEHSLKQDLKQDFKKAFQDMDESCKRTIDSVKTYASVAKQNPRSFQPTVTERIPLEYGTLKIRTLKQKNQDNNTTNFPTLVDFKSMINEQLPMMQEEVNNVHPECKIIIRQCRRFSKYSGDISISPASAVSIVEKHFNTWFAHKSLRLRIDQESFLINRVPKNFSLENIHNELTEQGCSIQQLRWLSKKNLDNPATKHSSLLLSVNIRTTEQDKLQRLRNNQALLLMNSLFPTRTFERQQTSKTKSSGQPEEVTPPSPRS